MNTMMIRSVLYRRTTSSVKALSTVARLGVRVPQRAQNYAETIRMALQSGVRCFDVDTDDDLRFSDALSKSIHECNVTDDHPIQILYRLGYKSPDDDSKSDPGDVLQADGMKHSLNPVFLQNKLENSKIAELSKAHGNSVQLIAMFQNPEVQCSPENKDRIPQLKEQLSKLYASAHDWSVSGFGILSHGLSLDASNPMHLPLDVICDQLSVVSFPVNVVERNGFGIAKQLRALFPTLQIYAMRPLHVFPSNQAPYKLVDYCLSEGGEKFWTHTLTKLPEQYETCRKLLLRSLDAEELLEKQAKGDATEDEKETIQVCSMLQELVGTLDGRLMEVSSLLEHDDLLVRLVMPTLSKIDLDEETGNWLGLFFANYNNAVRYAVSQRVRTQIILGAVPPAMRLQEYALRSVWEDTNFDRVIVGTSSPEQVQDTVSILS